MRRTVVILAAVAATLVLGSGVAFATTINCGFSSMERFCLGGDEPDILYGTPYQDYMNGKGGSDKLYGREAVNGLNRLQGEDFYGDPSKDGDDTLIGGPDTDVIEWAFGGNDLIKGGAGFDTLVVPEEDILEGGEVRRPTATPGVDRIFGGTGSDYIYALDGYKDHVNCGASKSDIAYIDQGLDKVVNCENKRTTTQ
jgi:Ca2+-binding RTX toxin-like protein